MLAHRVAESLAESGEAIEERHALSQNEFVSWSFSVPADVYDLGFAERVATLERKLLERLNSSFWSSVRIFSSNVELPRVQL